EDGEMPGYPTRHLVGHHLHEVADRQQWPLAGEELLGDVGHPSRLGRVQTVPAFGRLRVLPERLVRRHAPQLRRHVVVVGEELLRLPGGTLGTAAEQDGRLARPALGSRSAAGCGRPRAGAPRRRGWCGPPWLRRETLSPACPHRPRWRRRCAGTRTSNRRCRRESWAVPTWRTTWPRR